jgi:UMF1 family MFS transporter
MTLPPSRREVLAWALYDWANSAFATIVVAGFFPVVFRVYWSGGADPTQSTFRLGVASSLEGLLVLLAAPLLGAVADQGSLKKQFLLAFAALGILATGALALVAEGRWALALGLYIAAGIGFAASNIFYDALVVDVSRRQDLDRVSALGYALGYLGGGLALAAAVTMTHQAPGAAAEPTGDTLRSGFLLAALWWAAFSLPLAAWVRQRYAAGNLPLGRAFSSGVRQLRGTLGRIRQYRQVALFLAAYWLYIDGVDTVVRMAVDYGMALGFPAEQLVLALLVVQFVGFPAALAFGWLGGRIGPRDGILLGIAAYVGITVWGYFLDTLWEFYAVAVAIGLVQGGVQSLSRSLYARLVPPEESAEFFGFYNLVGKFAAILGPTLMGVVARVTADNRLSLLSLLVLFLLGGLVLLTVERRPDPMAEGGPPQRR